MRRGVLRVFTIALLGLTAWTAYANVFSDDLDVRARAGELARVTAGCGDACKVVSMHGDRGMLSETLAYDIEGKGRILVECRRAFVAFGEYACVASGP